MQERTMEIVIAFVGLLLIAVYNQWINYELIKREMNEKDTCCDCCSVSCSADGCACGCRQ
jgi:hypothetical protein